VFGLSFGELCVLLMVAMVVLGPQELPRYLRKAGQMAGKLRRLAYEMREKSGIDEVLRTEGLHEEIAELRKLARGEVMGMAAAMRSLTESARGAAAPASPYAVPAAPYGATAPYVPPGLPETNAPDVDAFVTRERELPTEGADSYGALPDTSVVYEGLVVASPLADDALYTRGVEAPRDIAASAPAPLAAGALAPASTPSA
jgi:sec-independent protein translocase protein TatB